MARIILLSQTVLDRMLGDPDFQEFAVLANPPRAKHTTRVVRVHGCGGCGRKRRKNTKRQVQTAGAVDYNAVKRALIELPEQQQAALKELLGCTGLKIQWRDHRKAVQRCVI